MGIKWPTGRLGDYAESCLGKMLDKEKNRGEFYPYLGNKNVRWGSFDLDDLAQMRFEEHEHERYGLRHGDLIVCEGGEPGRCAIWTEQVPGMKIQKALHRVRPLKGLNNYYLHYWFTWAGKNGLLDAYFTGTTIKHLTGKALADLEIPIPPLEEQERMVRILKSLDDKIELNRQINTTLESMAQALFKSWFVDFDPVIDNALAVGNLDAGRRDAGHPIPDELQARFARRRHLRENPANPHPTLPADIQQLFPTSFVFTEALGWVPEGWELVELKSLTQKIGSGATPRGGQKVYQDSGISLIRSQNVYDSNFVWDGLAYISDEAATQLKNVEVMSGDVLINITGASILRTCIVEPTVLPARVNQHVAIIRPKEGIPSKYLHLHLLNPRTKNHLMGQNAGGSREAVTKGHLESVPTLRPSDKVLNSFEAQTLALGKKSFSIGANSKVLESIRDSLLPKLLSGQLQIPEAEQQLAEVI